MACLNNSNPLVEAMATHLATTLGPWFVGSVGDFVLFGVLIMLASDYYNYYSKEDGLLRKTLVSLVLLANFLKSMQTFVIIWSKAIVGFGNYAVNVLDQPWYADIETLTTQIVSLVAQCYFIARLHRLSGHNWILGGVIVTVLLASVGANIALTVEILNFSSSKYIAYFNTTVTLYLGCTMSADILITGGTSYYLLFAKTGYKRVDSMISRLVRLTWISAAPPALCALLNMATYLSLSQYGNTDFIAFNTMLSKLYSVSLMYTINTRSGMLKGDERLHMTTLDGITTGIQLHGPVCPDLLKPGQQAQPKHDDNNSLGELKVGDDEMTTGGSFFVRSSEM